MDASCGFFDLTPTRSSAAVCICLPCAGGGAGSYLGWRNYLRPDVLLLSGAYPGRGVRYDQAPYADFEALMNELLPATLPWVKRPIALFGHSFGAWVAYELAYRLETHYGVIVDQLFVAAACSPHFTAPDTAALPMGSHKLSDGELLNHLRRVGGLAEIESHSELVTMALLSMRADLKLRDDYMVTQPPEFRPIQAPITCLGGLQDELNVPRTALQHWQHYTRGHFHLHMFLGDHFFINTYDKVMTQLIRDALGRRSKMAHCTL